MAKCVGFFDLGKEYAESADFLSNSVNSEAFRNGFDRSVDFLYAHAFELMLKGSLLADDPNTDVEDFGHDLLRLYDEVKASKILNDLVGSTEKVLKDRWKHYLQDARDRYESKLGLGQLTSKERREFGSLDNQAVGSSLPELRKQVIWLSKRHMNSGSEFRYPQWGLDQRQRVAKFGLSDDVVRRSSQWACKELYDRFRVWWISKPGEP